jgi:Inner membrane protein YgaP-like, transmembrane domain
MIMTKNEGNTDRIIRIILAAILAFLYFSGTVTGTLGVILLVVAVILAITALIGVCPIYLLLKMSTAKK